ncbi:hypothetical protein SAMN05421858_4848 [Haladaptatus litoreus]|uniref:Uncharacterized protein n=1 Tax=Haladaptatus litoreus TaxID=553468 RepID=A0A1N7F9T8_9EURY|nr:hypothetical protein [Haladaptatus litoreus]SIR96995.1 hypothetical protein SAMN05421858_4848 [Haladaptatus litoreus]
MPNTIKRSGDGLALQVTKPARAAGLVEEKEDGTTRLATVRVFAFDGLLLVVDIDRINDENIVEIATSAALDTVSIHRVANASLQIAGNGYQVQLPGAADAGFHVGDRAPCTPAPNLLVIAAEESGRVAADIVTIRKEQI